METITNNDLTIGTLVTNRHRQIAKFVREEHPHITRDIWHVAKGEYS